MFTFVALKVLLGIIAYGAMAYYYITKIAKEGKGSK